MFDLTVCGSMPLLTSTLSVLRACHRVHFWHWYVITCNAQASQMAEQEVGSSEDEVFPHSSPSWLQPITCCCLVCWCACLHSMTLSLVCADLKAWRGWEAFGCHVVHYCTESERWLFTRWHRGIIALPWATLARQSSESQLLMCFAPCVWVGVFFFFFQIKQFSPFSCGCHSALYLVSWYAYWLM